MPTTIINRAGDGDATGRALVAGVCEALAAAGHEVLVTPNLYHLPAEDPLWGLLGGPAPVSVLGWLYPRALEWLLRRRGLPCDDWRLLYLGDFSQAEEVVAALEAGEAPSTGPGTVTELAAAGPAVTRWYPVVDRSRCTDCGHCLQFCLFGVYEADTGGLVSVSRPDNCKAGCPACSRVCPAGAILFPLYLRDPAIAGAPGRLVQRDAEARRLYYARTEQPCPLCAARSDVEIAGLSADGCCPECGRELETGPAPSATLDEIDALLARLDDLGGRGR